MRCFTFALKKWVKEGGWLLIRKSDWGWFPHFAQMDKKGTISQFQPKKPRHRWCPPISYKGKIVISYNGREKKRKKH